MAEPLKNQFDADVVELLAERFRATSQDFDSPRFTAILLESFPRLELKQRINLVADTIAQLLATDYPEMLEIVAGVARTGVDGFAAWPLCSFVERHGVDHPELSLVAMETLTVRWSCEFAIRPFLDDHLELTRTFLRRWVHDDHEAIRRLASEGTRPRLPWGPKVQALLDDPEIGIELLEELRNDVSETVRRSVANHLNDLSRSDPDRTVEVLRAWADDPVIDRAMIRHALRTLVKTGRPDALDLLGFTTDAQIRVDDLEVKPAEISLGSVIELSAEVNSTADTDQLLVVDFVIHHVNATGATSPKVFKWTTLSLGPDESATLTKTRRIQTASTRRYHAGTHRIDLQVAGRVVASTSFDLRDSS